MKKKRTHIFNCRVDGLPCTGETGACGYLCFRLQEEQKQEQEKLRFGSYLRDNTLRPQAVILPLTLQHMETRKKK